MKGQPANGVEMMTYGEKILYATWITLGGSYANLASSTRTLIIRVSRVIKH